MNTQDDRHFENILLFDGVCNLCNGTVQFLLRIDRTKKLRFAALQSETGEQILARFRYAGPPLQTVVFCSGERLFTYSNGILEVCRIIGLPWSALYVFKLIPQPVRDAVYRWVARNRYQWFGTKETSWVPTPALKQRFLP